MKAKPDVNVIDWFIKHEGDISLTAITVSEMYYGVNRLPEGKRKERLFDSLGAIMRDCADKTFLFDSYCGYLCAKLRDEAISSGHNVSIEDLMIASICIRNDAILATGNVRDFDFLDIRIENPFEYDFLEYARDPLGACILRSPMSRSTKIAKRSARDV